MESETADIDQFFSEEPQRAASAAFSAFDDNPDDAARAVQIGRATGAPPIVVASNLEAFDREHRTQLTTQLLRDNRYLQSYLNDDPMAAKLSNGSLPQMDEVTTKLEALPKPLPQRVLEGARSVLAAPRRVGDLAMDVAAERGSEAFKSASAGKNIAYNYLRTYNISPMSPSGIAVSAFGNAADTLFGTIFGAFSAAGGLAGGAVAGLEAEMTKLMQEAGLVAPDQKPGKGSALVTNPDGTYSLGEAGSGAVTTDDRAKARANAIGEAIDLTFGGMTGFHPVHGPAPKAVAEIAMKAVEAKIAKALAEIKPWLDRGEEPPVGVSGLYDRMREEVAKSDMEALAEAEKAAHATPLRELDADSFAEFVRQHQTEWLTINADAVAKIYGDKLPELDDGVLGWHEGIADQLATAKLYGGDIEVPMAGWLSKVDPEVQKALRDDIRLRPGGLTLDEAKRVREFHSQREAAERAFEVEAYHGSRHDFEGFSNDAIGTGEGAQSFGYGHYVAEARGTAESYRLAGADDKFAPPKNQNESVALDAWKEANEDRNAAIELLKSEAARPDKQSPTIQKEFRAAINMLEQGWEPKKVGNLYRVRIKADKENFLDWDRDLADQPEIFKKIPEKFRNELEDYLDQHGQTPDLAAYTGAQLYKLLERWASEDALPGDTGIGGFPSKEAAEYLHRQGIPGVRYLDAGSRDKGEGTSNYVIFDPSIMEITHRNDLPVEPKNLVDHIAAVREALSAEPVYAPGTRRVSLKRAYPDKTGHFGPEQGFHDFEIIDHNGKAVGYVNLSVEGADLYVEMIQAKHANYLGFKQTLDLARQLAKEFPEQDWLTGHRVSGARDKAGSFDQPSAFPRIDLRKFRRDEALSADDIRNLHRFEAAMAKEAEWMSFDSQTDILFKDTYVGKKAEVVNAFYEEAARFLPKDVQANIVEAIRSKNPKYADLRIFGMYTKYADEAAQILASFEGPHGPIGTLRHEGVHHLKRYGYFSEAEWSALERAAKEEGWLEKFNINERYKYLDDTGRLEEAIADAYKGWKAGEVVPEPVRNIFEKLADLFEAILERVRRVLEEPDLQWENIFQKVDSGEVASRQPRTPHEGGKSRLSATREPELPGMTRMEDRAPFEPGAMSPTMTADMQKRYQKIIAARNKEDYVKALKRAEREQKAKLTEEWKRDRVQMRQEVEREINLRPDVAADLFFNRGELFGVKAIRGKPKINPEGLPPELVERLPPEWLSEKGFDPQHVSDMFGYKSPEAMFDALSEYQQRRDETGLGAKRYRDKLVEEATDRAMEQRYGSLQDNILNEAKDQAASQTQLNLLHEETLAMATAAGSEFSITKAEMKRFAAEKFEETTYGELNREQYLRAAAKAGRDAEAALLKNKPMDAYVSKQQQYLATAMAQQAYRLQKQQAQFARQVKRLNRREVKGIEPSFVDFAQELLLQAGVPLRVTAAEIAESKALHGHTTLSDFVYKMDHEYGMDLNIGIADLIQSTGPNNLEAGTVRDFRELRDAVNTLVKQGVEMQQFIIAGERMDRAQMRREIIADIEKMPKLPPDQAEAFLWRAIAALSRPERIIKELGGGKDLSPIYRVLFEPLAQAKGHEYTYMQDLVKKFEAIRPQDKYWQKSLRDKIEDTPWFIDPYTKEPFQLTRGQMINIMLNWGNAENKLDFAMGYGSPDPARLATKAEAAEFAQKIDSLLARNASKTDWDFVQSIFDIYESYKPDIAKLQAATSAKRTKWTVPEPIATPHGEYRGGHFPIIYDKRRAFIGPDNLATDKGPFDNGMLPEDYFRATTGKQYLKSRTGYSNRVLFTNNTMEVGMRFQQMLHDLSYREAFISAGKVIYDSAIRQAITNHMGKSYLHQLDSMMQRTANHFKKDELAIEAANTFLGRMRNSLVTYALPLNPNVYLSPSTGATNLITNIPRWFTQRNEMRRVAMEHSSEIKHTEYNIDRDFREKLESLVVKQGLKGEQAKWVRRMYRPLVWAEQQLRTITFYDEFAAAKARGLSDYDASVIADSAVRERHGAQSVVDLPSIMDSNEAMKAFTVFSGFFNTQLNWQMQGVNALKRGQYSKAVQTFYGTLIVPTIFGAALFTRQKEKDSWWEVMLKSIASATPLASVVIARDAYTSFVEGLPTRSPWGAYLQAVGSAVNDVKNAAQGKPMKKPIQHGITAVGMTAGVPGSMQIGRWGQAAYDVSTGRQRPKDFTEWLRIVKTGEANLPKR